MLVAPEERMGLLRRWSPRMPSLGRLEGVRHHWWPLLVHFVAWSVATTIALVSIIGGYVAFYRWYIPAERTAVPVYFQYDRTVPTYSMTLARVHPSVAYDISLQLTVPDIAGLAESTGNVMIKAQLQSGGERILSSRPTLLLYRSQATRLALLVLRLAPVLMGVARESSAHRVFLFEDVTFSGSTLDVSLTMDHKLPLYDATLEMVAHFTGLRYLMYYWRWTFGILVIGVLAFLSLLGITSIVAVSLYLRLKSVAPAVVRSPPAIQSSEEASLTEGIVIGSDDSSAGSLKGDPGKGSLIPTAKTLASSTARRRRISPPGERQVPQLGGEGAVVGGGGDPVGGGGGSESDTENSNDDSDDDMMF